MTLQNMHFLSSPRLLLDIPTHKLLPSPSLILFEGRGKSSLSLVFNIAFVCSSISLERKLSNQFLGPFLTWDSLRLHNSLKSAVFLSSQATRDLPQERRIISQA